MPLAPRRVDQQVREHVREGSRIRRHGRDLEQLADDQGAMTALVPRDLEGRLDEGADVDQARRRRVSLRGHEDVSRDATHPACAFQGLRQRIEQLG